jgi:hypothetical protein
MEISFQNTREDMNARIDYLLTQTAEGKKIGKRAFISQQIWGIMVVTWFGAIFWGLSGEFTFFVVISLSFLVICEFFLFLISSFKPIYYYGKKVYLNDLKNFTDNDWKHFLLSKTLNIGEDWLEEGCSVCSHRWRWSVVDKVFLNEFFIIIQIGNCSVISIPKRAFSSENDFQEFGKKLEGYFQSGKKDNWVASE